MPIPEPCMPSQLSFSWHAKSLSWKQFILTYNLEWGCRPRSAWFYGHPYTYDHEFRRSPLIWSFLCVCRSSFLVPGMLQPSARHGWTERDRGRETILKNLFFAISVFSFDFWRQNRVDWPFPSSSSHHNYLFFLEWFNLCRPYILFSS